MNRNDILTRLAENAAEAHIDTLETRLQADPFSGWRLAVVSDSFDSMSLKERKQAMLAGLEAEEFQWLDLITKDEAEMSGGLPLDFEPDAIPMWPEALARRVDASQPLVFASDLEDDLPSPVVVAFYSLRGGVGRSTALAYTAQLLARAGHTVLCVDMDLEAPGLAALFGKEQEVLPNKGVVALLQSFEMGDEPDVLDHVIRLSEYDELYCLPAGKPDADYARRLRLLDPESWYREEVNPLHRLMEAIRSLTFGPQVVLLDSRTGISPLSAPLLFDLEDLAVITFFPHPQARTGTGALVEALLKSHSRREYKAITLTPEPRFLVSPIPNSRAPEVMQRYRDRALEWISGWMAPVENGRRSATGELDAVAQYMDPEEITAFVTYRESIATSDAVAVDPESASPYSLVAEWIASLIPVPSSAAAPTQYIAQGKTDILNTLKFSTGTAENQDRFSESFVETETFRRALALDKPLVIGRKGTGKTAVFRRLTEDTQRKAVAVLCPAAFRPRYPWTISADGFKALDDALHLARAGWREFWNLYTCLCISIALKDKLGGLLPPGDVNQEIQPLLAAEEIVELDVVACLKALVRLRDVGLTAWEWLRSMDTVFTDNVPLVFDGLDTGFGNHADDRARRTSAIEGLFSFVMDRESLLKHCRFKILLRDDISRKIRFDNRSHLYGRSIHLQWQNQSDYAKTVLKQALLSVSFKDLVKESVPRQEVENWSEEEVFRVWNALVGERMKGSRTAFTRNWVWNRLADGNNDHGPRVLLQLFHEATAWERNENTKNPENRYIIRPKALSSSLDVTSREAVSAIQEEFTELDDLIQRLKQIGRSPIDAGDLDGVHEALDLAREVGLIQIYEGTEEDVKRYRVPDLYRIGLGLTRKGQL